MTNDTTLAELLGALSSADESPELDLALNPRAASTVGAALAERARSGEPTMVLSWSGDDDIVLGHIVASELGVPRAVVDLDLGLITVSPALAPGSRVVLVAPQFSAHRPIGSIATMLSTRGHTLVLAAALTGSPQADPGDVSYVTLG